MSLHDAIDGYIAFKHALGMRMGSEARLLRAFGRAMGNIDVADVKAEAAHTFIAGAGPITRTWKQKASVLRSFYRYAISRGLTISAPLPAVSPHFPPTRTPYIYSTEEIKHLLAATETLRTLRCPLRALAYRTLLLLLYGTGLRTNEALALTVADVDLTNSLITVRDTKFFKTRLVPTAPRLTRELADYARRRCRELPMPAGDGSAFFATDRSGTRWHWVVADELFRRIRKEAGVGREGNARHQPCLHDFRHTTAQHHLLAWYRAGRDVQHLLPKLATYLGHVNVSSTQYYLTMTPELLQEAGQRFERYAQPEHHHA